MLKGTVTFETFKNGKLIQKESAENMVTEAVDKIMSMSPWFSEDITKKLPLAQKLLGGLFMFDGQLTANASNIYFPGKDAKLIGMGGRITDTQDPIRGTFDDTVSGPVENGYKSVWKFTESQAIGSIRSIALTSVNAGTGINFAQGSGQHIDPMSRLTNAYSTSGTLGAGFIDRSHDGMACPLRYDEDTQTMYYAVKESGQSNYDVKVYKRKIPIFKYGVNDGGLPGHPDIVYPREYVGSLATNYPSSYNFINSCRFTDDGYVYYWKSANYGTYTVEIEGAQVQVTGLKLEDFKKLKLSSLTTDSFNIVSYGNIVCPITLGSGPIALKFTICRNYIYVTNGYSTGNLIYRVPFTVDDEHSTISFGTAVAYPSNKTAVEKTNNLYTLRNGVVLETIYTSETTKYANIIYDVNDPTTDPKSFVRVLTGVTNIDSTSSNRNVDMGIMRFMWNGNANIYLYPYEEYLGTIFNLQNQVNKEDNMTMTVTYTLTNVPINS